MRDPMLCHLALTAEVCYQLILLITLQVQDWLDAHCRILPLGLWQSDDWHLMNTAINNLTVILQPRREEWTKQTASASDGLSAEQREIDHTKQNGHLLSKTPQGAFNMTQGSLHNCPDWATQSHTASRFQNILRNDMNRLINTDTYSLCL